MVCITVVTLSAWLSMFHLGEIARALEVLAGLK
jgi:hypothetical protein